MFKKEKNKFYILIQIFSILLFLFVMMNEKSVEKQVYRYCVDYMLKLFILISWKG